MHSIGVRELRQHASRWLERVRHGESFAVTHRGRRVALLIPPPRGGGVDELVATGRARPGTGDLGSLAPPTPVPDGATSPSAALAWLRADER